VKSVELNLQAASSSTVQQGRLCFVDGSAALSDTQIHTEFISPKL